ncbi:cytochrome P450 [Chthonobacter rhizosphaerae]|uniref:cytochrome P450 n=1 Tax=Chthonobacter rhizosphaerae TaxID=2735553 RepID=UPI0015EF7174|nr:cytochrome P450 [Chthonobacter rhizosphaerae]
MSSKPLHFAQPPADHGFGQDPYPAYHRMRALGPAVFWEDYGFWCFPGFEAVSALLRDKRFGRAVLHVASRQELGWPEIPERLKPFYDVEAHSLLETEPPVHTRLRTLVNRAFVSQAVERLRPRITALAHELIDRFEPAGSADLIGAFATPIPVIVIADLLGVPASMADQLLDWSHRMVAMYQFNRTRAMEDDAVAATEAFVAFMRSYVDERRSRPADDLISHLIAAEEAGERLSTDELITTCILLLNAGHEATVHAIGNGVKAVLEAGADPAAAFATAKATESAVEELLRFDAPLHLFTRYALEDAEVHGVPLKRGDRIGLLLGAANRDPARFAEPDRLILDRTDVANVSFGAGIHFCVGAPLARLELQIALPVLFRRLPGLRLAAQPVYADRYHFHGLKRLDVTW